MRTSEEALECLGLAEGADERAVRRAYAHLLKNIDQFNEPQKFMELRKAYEQALAVARWNAEQSDDAGKEVLPAVFKDQVQPEQHTQNTSRTSLPPEINQDREDQNINEDRYVESVTPSVRAEAPAQVAERLLETLDWHFQPWDVDAAIRALKGLLASTELESFEAREAFEHQLAWRIASKEFGATSSALLVAADVVFDWRCRGVWVPSLESLLDDLAALHPSQNKVVMALLGEPDPAVARVLKLTPESLGLFYLQWRPLLDWWLPDGHLQRWRNVWGDLPIQVRAAAWFLRAFKDVGAKVGAYSIRMVLVCALPIAVVFVVNLIADRTHAKQEMAGNQACAQTLAIPRAQGWYDVPVEKIAAWAVCSSKLNVATMADLRGLAQAQRIADVLTRGEQSVSNLGRQYLHLNLRDGRAFGFVRSESSVTYCPELRNFALHASWMQLGDVGAGKALLQELAWCEELVQSTGTARSKPAEKAESYLQRFLFQERSYPAFMLLLRHIDAWPNATKPTISLYELVREATPPGFDWRLPTEVGRVQCAAGSRSALQPCEPVANASKAVRDIEVALRRFDKPKIPGGLSYEKD